MTGLELIVAAIAASFAGHQIQIECVPNADLPRTYVAYAHADGSGATISIDTCRSVRWIVKHPDRPNVDPYAAYDFMVIGHEAAHLLGNPDERGATCWSLGSMVRVLRGIGVRAHTARIMRQDARESIADPAYYC